MRTIIKAGTTAMFMSFLMVSEAFAWCGLTGDCGLTPAAEPVAAPEFDGPGAVAAIALLVSIVAVVYQRARR